MIEDKTAAITSCQRNPVGPRRHTEPNNVHLESLTLPDVGQMVFVPNQTFGIEIELTSPSEIPEWGSSVWRTGARSLLACLRSHAHAPVATRSMGCHENRDPTHWVVERDWSAGWEVVSPLLENKVGIEELQRVYSGLDALVRADDRFHLNYRTGLHVTLARRLDSDERLQGFVKRSQHLEPGLMPLVAPSRFCEFDGASYDLTECNGYCRPMRETFHDIARRPLQDFALSNDHYYTVNLAQAYEDIQKLEVRLPSGTTGFRKDELRCREWPPNNNMTFRRSMSTPSDIMVEAAMTWRRSSRFSSGFSRRSSVSRTLKSSRILEAKLEVDFSTVVRMATRYNIRNSERVWRGSDQIGDAMRTWFCGLLAFVMTCSDAWAWNPSGHQTIASIIFRELSVERRMELAELLTHHPRYQADFLADLPAFLRNADAETTAEWRFQQASIWSDIVRDGPADRVAFNRPFWHYLPRGFFLTQPSESFRKQVESGFNRRLDPVGGTANLKLNGPQAFQANLEVLNDAQASQADRAVALCWVLHIGQDLHQPCHTASLCDPVLFPRGDRGANDIKTKQLKNLHAVWDGPLGPDQRFIHCRNLAIQLRGDASPATVNQKISSPREQLELWLAEGLEFAESDVYIDEVRDQVRQAPPLKTIDLSPRYLRNVRRVANGRIIHAGIRLAKLLEPNE